MTEIIVLPDKAFYESYRCNGGKVWYYFLIRAFVFKKIIYLRKNAVYIFPDSKEKIILHEQGHIDGKKHTWFGIMAWHGLFRM